MESTRKIIKQPVKARLKTMNSSNQIDPAIFDDYSSHYDFELGSEYQSSIHENPQSFMSDKVSDAYVYGPKFCEIYNQFNATCQKRIDPSRHLMTLCIDYLIPFCQWARESDDTTNYLRNKLMDHEYLRAEVRNGIIMVIIYTFASIKAVGVDQADMFSTLQDSEKGLGISNKFSLRIYNDPYNYLSFLKSSLSSLIDAGVIPDNERLNQPKKNKLKYENKEELQAFIQLKNILVNYLDSNNNTLARNFVSHVTNFWGQRGKFIRNRRFVSALQYIQQTPVPTQPNAYNTALPQQQNAVATPPTNHHSSRSKDINPIILSETTRYSDGPHVTWNIPGPSNEIMSHSNAEVSLSMPPPVGVPSISRQTNPSLIEKSSASTAHPVVKSVSSSKDRFRPLTLASPLHMLHFERVNRDEWTIKSCRIFDIAAFLNSLVDSYDSSGIYLVDCAVFRNSNHVGLESLKKYTSKQSLGSQLGGGFAEFSLQAELDMIGCLTASWSKTSELQQFMEFIRHFQYLQQNNVDVTRRNSSSSDSSTSDKVLDDTVVSEDSLSLMNVWNQEFNNLSSIQLPRKRVHESYNQSLSKGVLVFETVSQIGIILRLSPTLNIPSDAWCLLYPNELATMISESGGQSDNNSNSFEQILNHIFPQFKSKFALRGGNDILVKYTSHRRHVDSASTGISIREVSIPKQKDESVYRTIGVMSQHASMILSRLDKGCLFHDFVVSII